MGTYDSSPEALGTAQIELQRAFDNVTEAATQGAKMKAGMGQSRRLSTGVYFHVLFQDYETQSTGREIPVTWYDFVLDPFF